jgi:signal transduction histidine kinase
MPAEVVILEKMPVVQNRSSIYAALLAMALAAALAIAWTPLGAQIDHAVYDWMFRLYRPQPWQTQSILLAIDEASLTAFGGMAGLRKALAEGLERIAPAAPTAVAVDVTLADPPVNPESDASLEAAFRHTRNLILACDLLPDGAGWDDPIPQFRRWAAAVGHVHTDLDADAVSRELPLEKAAGRDRRWALALEAFRASRPGATILESPGEIEVAGVVIPASRDRGRAMRIRFVPQAQAIPRISLKQLSDDPSLARRFSGKVVFAGVTAQTAVRDRWLTPYSSIPVPGLEINANAFETIAQQRFLRDAPGWTVLLFAASLAALAGVTYRYLTGWLANSAAALILVAPPVASYVLFTRGVVLPFTPGAATAWFTVAAAAVWQHRVVRGRLDRSEAERVRYQHAMHFVTHEMRTPLTAIQGSSELMERYSMSEEKRKQIAQLIHSESKRLGRMIEIFLNVERLSAGEVELKRESFPVAGLMASCLERTRPLADRKQIRLTLGALPDFPLEGDRELMEYAIYNLLTNAIKYSPPRTEVAVFGHLEGNRVHVSVQDQGMGMDRTEVRRIFQKFYRTKKAEQSGEAGTGIGLAIVEQIVARHGGGITVESQPGKGSCFTLVLPGAAASHAKMS